MNDTAPRPLVYLARLVGRREAVAANRAPFVSCMIRYYEIEREIETLTARHTQPRRNLT